MVSVGPFQNLINREIRRREWISDSAFSHEQLKQRSAFREAPRTVAKGLSDIVPGFARRLVNRGG
jgi:hypothetical protein